MSKMNGLDNVYIRNTLQGLCKDFIDVFSSDNIPPEISERNNFTIICNLSKCGDKGTHFITIVVDCESVVYIDSLGLPCINEDISKFLNRLNRPISYNTRTIQHPNSVFCGYYCIFYALLFDSGTNVDKKDFVFSTSNLYKNDKLCIKYIKQLISMCEK